MRWGRLAITITSPLLFVACGYEGFDAGNPLRTRPPPVTTTDPTEVEGSGGGGGGGEDGDDDGAGNASSSPSSSSGAATTTVAPAKGSGVFANAPGYVATLGPSARKAKHVFAMNTPASNPAGRPCLGCHGAAGPGPRFAFAGTIFKDDNATQPATQVEVRVVDASGQVLTAYTDDDGNYFVRMPATPIAFPATAGARDRDTSRTMLAAAAAGNCNNCHRTAGSAGGPIALP